MDYKLKFFVKFVFVFFFVVWVRRKSWLEIEDKILEENDNDCEDKIK